MGHEQLDLSRASVDPAVVDQLEKNDESCGFFLHSYLAQRSPRAQ